MFTIKIYSNTIGKAVEIGSLESHDQAVEIVDKIIKELKKMNTYVNYMKAGSKDYIIHIK